MTPALFAYLAKKRRMLDPGLWKTVSLAQSVNTTGGSGNVKTVGAGSSSVVFNGINSF